MSTFDIQSMVPDGYEICGAHKTRDDSLEDGELLGMCVAFSLCKKWTPKVGEVVAVRDSEDMDWDFDAFEILRDDADHPVGCARDYWAECRKLTPQERGE